MPILFLLLAAGVFAYFIWRSRTSSLTRDCRWRQHRKEGVWICAYCGARQEGVTSPTTCLQGNQ
ncbi:hypothetical protein [Ruegeria arenilitoris]|uniref:hypothetical protein n=1 Tax=Ruegeria arenilitoris TaxID=1173585 RepID=UPI00147E7B2E|nr:hypothetical protein [Ruegeria arenilitoris]